MKEILSEENIGKASVKRLHDRLSHDIIADQLKPASVKKRDIKEEESECDLMEEWERSEDFKKKYRTVHP